MNMETSSPGMDDSYVNTIAAKDYRGPSQNIATAGEEGVETSTHPATQSVTGTYCTDEYAHYDIVKSREWDNHGVSLSF